MSIIKYLLLAMLLAAGPAAAQSGEGWRDMKCGPGTWPCPGAVESDAMSAAESDLAWQLHIMANADFVDIDGKMYLRMNPEAHALWQLLHKEH